MDKNTKLLFYIQQMLMVVLGMAMYKNISRWETFKSFTTLEILWFLALIILNIRAFKNMMDSEIKFQIKQASYEDLLKKWRKKGIENEY